MLRRSAAMDVEGARRRVEFRISRTPEAGLTLLGTRLRVHGLSTVEMTVVLRSASGEIHVLMEDVTRLIEEMELSDTDDLAEVVVSHAENITSTTPVGRSGTVVHRWR